MSATPMEATSAPVVPEPVKVSHQAPVVLEPVKLVTKLRLKRI